jgi:hypothetical protein
MCRSFRSGQTILDKRSTVRLGGRNQVHTTILGCAYLKHLLRSSEVVSNVPLPSPMLQLAVKTSVAGSRVSFLQLAPHCATDVLVRMAKRVSFNVLIFSDELNLIGVLGWTRHWRTDDLWTGFFFTSDSRRGMWSKTWNSGIILAFVEH